jgi:hypothetical protein
VRKLIKFFIINILLLLLLLNSQFYFAEVSAISNLSWFDVIVSPSAAGENAEYILTGGVSEDDGIDTIKIQFQWDTTFQNANVMYSSIVINGINAKAVHFEKLDKDIVLNIVLGKNINKGSKIEILIKKEAGIINPTTPRICFAAKVTLMSRNIEVQYLGSSQYEITQSVVTIKEVKAEPPLKGSKAEYFIQFITGVNGRIKAQTEEIRVRFPDGTSIGPNNLSDAVLINNTAPTAVYRDPDGTIRIYSNTDIKAKTLVSLYFKKSAGIINPKIAGFKVLKISTYTEPEWVESPPFEIVEPEIKDLKVEIDKNFIGAESTIGINFKTSAVGFIPKGGKIFVEFSDDFKLPMSLDPGVVKVNETEVSANISGRTVEIIASDSIYQNSEVSIFVSEKAKIENPQIPSNYSITVYTDSDSFRKSVFVEILPSKIDDLNFKAVFSGINTANKFYITFKTGPVYALDKDIDRIKITFDENFVYPDDPPQNLIAVNGTISQNFVIEVHSLYITTPLDIQPGSLVEVEIPETFGIRNPANLGEYGVRVSTSKEVQEVESNKIKITPLPVVEFTINPSQPDGMNGFYKTNPEIMLSTSNGVKVFYKVDDGEFAEFTAAPFKIDEGTHAVYAYAMDEGGNKGDTIKKQFSVDNTPPKITFDNANSDPYFKESPGKLTGSVSEPCTLKINEVILELKDDLHFSVELNVYEGMPIALFARDLAGNAATLLLTARIDSKPPVITFISKVNRVQGLGINSVETTEPAYTIQLKIDEKGKVFIDSNEMFSDGQTYSYNAYLIDGDNQFIIKAVDAAGNEAIETLLIKKVNEKKITLQISSNLASVGSETINLEAPPFIEKGFTLVPLRFISEAFGASVDWNDALKVITINYRTLTIQLQVGSTVAVVDNSIVKLDAPPKIMNGRTFVPIRFISETFGATVDWDGTTKTITITYKP